MYFFSDQCLDMARSILGHNLDCILPEGLVTPASNEPSCAHEPGHAALAMGAFFCAQGTPTLDTFNLVELSARCITTQVLQVEDSDNGFAYSMLGLLSFGATKDRNPVWEQLSDEIKQTIDQRLALKPELETTAFALNIVKSVARFSLGFTKKDETGKLIDRFIDHIQNHSSGGFVDDNPESFGGAFDIRGLHAFVLIRQALNLHVNLPLKEHKLPSLRTYGEKYLRLVLELVRTDGLGWCFGKETGAYSQLHSISLILQAIRDGWINETQMPLYVDALKRMFQFFFLSYLDQEHGYLVIRDEERSTCSAHTTRMANYDAVIYLCQWYHLAKTQGIDGVITKADITKPISRFTSFDKTSKKEQGVFTYNDPSSKLHIQLPLITGNQNNSSDVLAFPHCPGVFDWPVNKYLPIMLPELTFGDHVCIPSFYGKHCSTGLGLRNSFYFRYEQPDLITKDEVLVPNLGSCKVNWTFAGSHITSEFIFTVKKPVQLDSMRYMLAVSIPHSQYRISNSYALGEESLRAVVVKDDFQSTWQETEIVTDNPEYKTYYGKLHYLQILSRTHVMQMYPNQQYRLTLTFNPHIITADEYFN